MKARKIVEKLDEIVQRCSKVFQSKKNCDIPKRKKTHKYGERLLMNFQSVRLLRVVKFAPTDVLPGVGATHRL